MDSPSARFLIICGVSLLSAIVFSLAFPPALVPFAMALGLSGASWVMFAHARQAGGWHKLSVIRSMLALAGTLLAVLLLFGVGLLIAVIAFGEGFPH
jgi:hypothetical protein